MKEDEVFGETEYLTNEPYTNGSSCKLVVANYCHNCGAEVVSDDD